MRRGVREYNSWYLMRRRCTNPRLPEYANYGGRGITVCDRWLHSYELFLADMGPRPTPNHTLDRIDNDGNYEPGNCRWATRAEQMYNQRRHQSATVGTTYIAKRKKWLAQIKVNWKNIFLGLFATREEAHAAYCEAARKYRGEFARVS